MHPEEDSIDVREIVFVLRRGFRWIALGAILGLAAGGAATALLPPRYEGRTKILLRSNTDAPVSALSLLSGMAGGGLGGLLPGGRTGVDTELEILTSRSVIGAVVDSLGLQLRVVRPSGTAPAGIVQRARIDADIERGRYRFRRSGDGFDVTGAGVRTRAQSGGTLRVREGEITLRDTGLPDAFVLELLGREDAITRVANALKRSNSGGEVVQVDFRARDPQTAAAVPNVLFRSYLDRRSTTDRGVNRRRFEFLLQKEDSISAELAEAELDLRRHQEVTGVLDPRISGTAELERGMRLRGDVEALDVEIRSIERITARIGEPGAARELAAYPTFLANAAINDLLSRLFQVETDLLELEERRSEVDPDVVVLVRTVAHLEGQLVGLSRDYLTGLRRQRNELAAELAGYQGLLAALPASAEQSYRLEREVKRLAETQLLMQAQLIDARLAAITEGGDVRQVDVAVAPREAAFPSLPLNLFLGLFLGLFGGVLGALGRGYLGSSVKDPWEAELAAGVPARSLNGRVPMLLPRTSEREILTLVPLGRGATAHNAARQLASTASAQGRSVALVDLEERADTQLPLPPGGTDAGRALDPQSPRERWPNSLNGSDFPIFRDPGTGSVRALLDDLERDFSLVVIALPTIDQPRAIGALSPERPVVIVVRPGLVSRGELQEAVISLQRAGITTLGVILE